MPQGETVKITVTPVGEIPAECFGPNSISCILDTCLITPTISHNAGPTSQETCSDVIISDMTYTIGGGATGASITSGSLPSGVTGTLVGNIFTISGTATSSGNYNFTITTSGGCGKDVAVSGSINIIERTIPEFAAINAICEDENFTLPLLSTNGITGTWTPAMNNTATTEYTFTPTSGQCANPSKLTVNINSKSTPVFTVIAPICEGETIILPLRSNNGINGTWSPAINNTVTTEYTFTPDSGQCANPSKLTVSVNSKPTPVFTAIAPICEGETIILPLWSNNGINGTWSPTINNTATTEYTFTPNSGQCANTAKLTVNVNVKTVPLFSSIAPICEGETFSLPLQSNNGILGTWLPEINNFETTEYIFTPNNSQCAASSKLNVIVHLKPEPKIENGRICIENSTNKLIQSYVLNTQLNNSLYTFEWFLEGNKIKNQISSTLEAAVKGHYAVIAIDKNTNCISNISEALVTSVNINSGEINIVQSESFSENPTITVNVTNALGLFEYQIDNSSFQSENQFTNVTSGKHTIHVKSVDGCTDLSKEIVVIGYPKFFTPNGDGQNDTWNIAYFDGIENEKIFIFDRYGKLLKQLNSKVLGWDGTYNGHQMPATDYWFKILFSENKIEKEFKSHFSLKR